MIWAVVLKLAMLAFAAHASIRARYRPGIGALVSAAYLALARLASLVSPYPAMPLRDTLVVIWWLYPVLALALSFGPTIFAFLAARELEGDARARRERVGYAFLANVVLDVLVLVLVIVTLASGDA